MRLQEQRWRRRRTLGGEEVLTSMLEQVDEGGMKENMVRAAVMVKMKNRRFSLGGTRMDQEPDDSWRCLRGGTVRMMGKGC